MILANLRLVTSIARKRMPRATTSMDFEDLQQAGLIDLMRAVDKFDHTLGYKFSTYATWWIKQSMSRAIDDESRTVRLPVHAAESTRKVDLARRRAGLTWDEALADPSRLGDEHSVEDVQRTRDLLRPWLSLEEIADAVDVVDEGSDPLATTTDRVDAERTWRRLREHLQAQPSLGPRAAEILQMRHGFDGRDPMTLDQIGQRFGVTRERIRQIEKKSLEALREL
ncbi:sigma-70 family RNA polymerase sigma factor [Janibacter anophelis]|uniref:sigma-70 family RNA polymerase sigma factor n=1 Tax=Janibacter anophelis TaxID=319054 RepID=UPI003F7F730F